MTRTLTTGGTGPASTVREYIWLPGAEIAPTMASSGAIDRPIAVVEDVETASPLLWYVHVLAEPSFAWTTTCTGRCG